MPDKSNIKPKNSNGRNKIDLSSNEIDKLNAKIWDILGANLNQELKDCQSIIQAAKSIEYTNGLAFGYLNLGYCYLFLTKHENSLTEFQRALEYYREIEDIEGEIKVLNGMGIIYIRIDLLEKALEYFSNTYDMACKINNQERIATALNNLGDVFCQLERYSEAFEHYKKGLAITQNLWKQEKEVKNIYYERIAIYYGNISNVYIEQKKYSKALEYLDEGIMFTKKYDLNNYYAKVLGLKGFVYSKQKKYDMAENLFDQALSIAEKIEDLEFYGKILVNYGKHFYDRGLFQDAIKYLVIAWNKSVEKNYSLHLYEIYKYLYLLYKKVNDFEKSLQFLEKFTEFESRKFNDKISNKISILLTDFVHKQTIHEKEIYRLKHIELKKKSSDLEHSYTNISLLSSLGKKITSNLQFEDIMESVYKGVNTIMDAAVLGLALVNKKREQIELKYLRDRQERITPDNVSIFNEKSSFAECIRNKKEIIIHDIKQEKGTDFLILSDDETAKIPRSLIFLPLITAEETIGAVTIQSYEPHSYTIQQIEMLRVLGSYFLSGLKNSLAHEEVNSLNKMLAEEKSALESANKRIKFLADHDDLTDLPNRRLFSELAAHEISNAARNKTGLAIFYLDLDNFKIINDTY